MSASWAVGNTVADRITALRDSSARFVLLMAGNSFIEIFEYSTPEPKLVGNGRKVCDHGITHICLDVIDIDAEYSRLKASGMQFHCPPQDYEGGIRLTYGRDPDGNVIELQEIQRRDNPIHLSGLEE